MAEGNTGASSKTSSSVATGISAAKRYDLVPTMSGSLSVTGVSVGLEDRMTIEECDALWVEIFRLAGVTTVDEQILLRNGFLLWLAHNGSSNLSDFKTKVTINNTAYSSKLLRTVVGDRLRAFFRAQATLTHSILEANTIVPLWGQKYGFEAPYQYYGFDVADSIPGIPYEVAQMLADAKSKAVAAGSRGKTLPTQKNLGSSPDAATVVKTQASTAKGGSGYSVPNIL